MGYTRFNGSARSVAFAAASVACVSMLLAGCGGGDKKDKPATQTAAKVNKEEITVHQINYVLRQQRALPPEQAASASRQVLSRLVDQELAVQKAQDQKIDREPRVVQQIDAARREIISRAYIEKIGAGAPKPTPEEIKTYYDANPALFKERRVYSFQELSIEAKPEQGDALRAQLKAAKDINAFVTFLKANDFKFAGNQAVRAAEQLPLGNVNSLAKMKDGEAIFNATASGAQVIVLASSRSQPVDEARAKPAIEQFLLNERKRKVIEDDLKALRASAQIEYLGEFSNVGDERAKAEAAAAAALATAVKPSTSSLVSAAASAASAAAIEVKPAALPASANMEKGFQGLK